ncbi:MAG: histidine-type phosphatase [Bacillota bacterium]
MKKLSSCISILLLTLIVPLQAQTTKEELLSNTNFAGGLYCPYIYTAPASTSTPEGYTPFYISHYGRHGSRWVLSSNCHDIPLKILGEAFTADKLTALGKSLFERIRTAAEDAAGRYGDLSPLGVKEQKEIAERMFKSFPEVFSTRDNRKCFIYSRSTQVPRCILSMAANNERLKELNPEIEIVREAAKKNIYLNNDAATNRDTVKTIVSDFKNKHFNAGRFIASIFTDTSYANQQIKDPANFAYLIFSAAINLPNLDHLKLSMMDVFTSDEIFTLWEASNIQMYYEVGPSTVNGKAAIKSAALLLKDILDCADKAIKNKNISADLRFGHDTYIIPLLALIDIKNMNIAQADPEKVYSAWSNFKASPMGSNLQLVFYKNDENDDVLVKLLHCEKEVEIPVKTDIAPYYHWKDIKAYYESKIANL